MIYYERLNDGSIGRSTNSERVAKLHGYFDPDCVADDTEAIVYGYDSKRYLKSDAPQKPQELIDKENAKNRISELIQMLYDTDHHALKYAEGIISADNYLAMRDLRQSWRDEINALEVKYAIDSKQLQKGVQ